ncbi:MAG: hypothetical protein HY654_02840 [Acidobacteria bacterium]|nr:hypothetical protein [Acidobacteriota bacterium]
MMSKPVVLAALVVGCLAAAAAGGYLAARQSNPDAATAIAATPAAPVPDTPVSGAPMAAPAQAVHESEAVVEPAKPAAAPVAPAVETRPLETRRPKAVAASRPAKAAATRENRRVDSSATADPSSTPPPPGSADQSWKGLDRPWPAGNAAETSQPPSATAGTTAAGTSVPPVEPPPPPAPPTTVYEELVVPSDSVIGLQLDTPLTSERARLEDRVESRVTRDVRVGERVAIPAGSQVIGSVTQVERGGKFKERARLGIKFHTLVLADGTRIPLTTDTIYREGAAPGKESAAKIGGAAVGGAILGAIFGGGKGAAIGGAAGAAGGSAAVAAGDRNAVALPAGTNLTVRVLSPVTIEVEKEQH